MSSTPAIPSPTPPYARNSATWGTPQTLEDDGEILLSRLTTYLVATTDKTATLPDGSKRQQPKNIFIPTDMLTTTGVWEVTGTFAGFTKLRFTNLGQSAQLEWDGAGWQLVGGNAEAVL